jgi:hypothetical protein
MDVPAWTGIALTMVGLSVAPAWAQITVLPLGDAGDPITISGAAFDGDDPSRPVITIRLENTTSQPLATDRIWLSVSKFYTPAEMQRNGDRVAFTCGITARANNSEPTQIVHPGASVPIRFWAGPNCGLDPGHTHFFIVVERITPGQRFVEFTWKRDPADFARLLQAAMPHAW